MATHIGLRPDSGHYTLTGAGTLTSSGSEGDDVCVMLRLRSKVGEFQVGPGLRFGSDASKGGMKAGN